jgi:hypothetical protein
LPFHERVSRNFWNGGHAAHNILAAGTVGVGNWLFEQAFRGLFQADYGRSIDLLAELWLSLHCCSDFVL